MADTLTGLAHIHFMRKEYEPAEELLERALKLKEEALGATAHELIGTLTKLGKVSDSLQKTDAAVAYYKRAHSIDSQIDDSNSWGL